MRYWILVALFNGLFMLITKYVAPERIETEGYYAGLIICSLIALVITWRDPPDMLDKALSFILKWGIFASGLAFFAWGVGYKMELWGNDNPDELVSSISEPVIVDLALGIGALFVLFICGALWRWYLRCRERT